MDSSLESAKKAVGSGMESVDQSLKAVSSSLASGLSSGVSFASSVVQEGYEGASKALDKGQDCVSVAMGHYRQAEDLVFSTATAGLHWSAANPYIAYPAAGLGSLVLLPFTRRLLYRATLGRLRTPTSVVKICETRVKGVATQMEDYAQEVTKLTERSALAEQEYRSGLAKLRSARQELQRLSASLARGERSSQGVLQELRTISPKTEGALQLRSDAAAHLSSLKSQRYKVDAQARRIINMDI